MRRLFLILVPGIGLIQRDRTGRGILQFFLFAFLVNFYLMGQFVVSGDTLPIAALIGAGLIWLWSARDAIKAPRESEEPAEQPGDTPTPVFSFLGSAA